MRLIDAEELGEKIEEEFDGICAYDVSPDEAVNDFQDIVDSCKTIDAAPVVHGHWSKEMFYTEDFMGNRTYGYKCSVCDKLANRLQFCGNCGSKMDESEETE